MARETIQFNIPGVRIDSAPDSDVQALLKIEAIRSQAVIPTARGEAPPEPTRVDVPPDALVKVEYQSGISEWLRADQFAAELGASRSAGAVTVPTVLNRGADPSRGPADWVLKGLHFFGISPADALAEETAHAVIDHFEGKLNTGLFPLQADGSFGKRIDQPLAPDPSGQPYLVFVHGTASSTEGSFSGFWNDLQSKQPTNEWNDVVQRYAGRILALEHRTFSVSPAQNTLDLVGLLPAGATLHVITHSRGGLVGELLGLGPLSERDLKPFQSRPDAKLLSDLTAALQAKRLNVAKFVRTACPAAGTILASKRIDLYLNIILNVIGLIPALGANPAYALFKATALELIKLRADPYQIPGIEAQMPESPLIHLLNTRGRYSDADLGVIAGNFEGSGVWGTLKSYALRAYYWQDNDFVVNTKSMSGGMDRKKGVWQFLDQGDTVNHFSYFKNARTRSRMLGWLAAPAAETDKDFTRVRGVVKRASVRGAEQLPMAFLLPDAFGTHLRITTNVGAPELKRQVIWLDYDALSQGRFPELAYGQPDVTPAEIHESYKALYTALSLTHDAVMFPYDWRKPIRELGVDLKNAVDAKAAAGRKIWFVAHGMGGLVVREFARTFPEAWGENCSLLMLGTPNLGSWQIARLLAGQARLVHMLALLGRSNDAEVVKTLQNFPGLIDLLPDEMLRANSWNANALGQPDPDHLEQSRRWRESLNTETVSRARMSYVAGSAPATPSGMDQYTSEGDGHVAYSVGPLANMKTWYSSDDAHGNLLIRTGPLIELLTTGYTAFFDTQQHPRTDAPNSARLLQQEQAVLFPSERDLVNAALGFSEQPVIPPEMVLHVRVAHGHLREAKHPLAIGHYVEDSIVSGEAQLDRQLSGRLSKRFHMGLYPGPLGTAEVVLAPDAHPPGALVMGLGEVGEITPERVRKGALEICMRYALTRSEGAPQKNGAPLSAAISSLLIGVSGGRALSIPDSMASIVRGALEANRVLRRRNLWDQVRIDQIEFVELYEDAAVEASRAASHLQQILQSELEAGEHIQFDCRLRSLPGGLYRRPLDEYASGWWRRIQITADRKGQPPQEGVVSATALKFEALTDRARAEESLAATQITLVNSLLEDATSQASYNEGTAVTLFELLVPNALKDQAQENANLVLVLDETAAQFPWELMARRAANDVLPLATRMGLMRQLKLSEYRIHPRGAHGRNALVIGDSVSDLPELPGAQDEARAVAKLLEESGYAVTPPLIRSTPLEIVRRLFTHDYRILHLAGHGIYNPDNPANSGMVLARGVYLTPLELCQIRNLPELVFINCCHLGRIDQRLQVRSPYAMAASVAQQLIKDGVQAVVAAGWAVNDSAAVVFAQTFYRQMLSGRKLGESVLEARKAAHALGNNNTWGSYQCYGNPDFVLTAQSGAQGPTSYHFCSRREYLEGLKNIVASAKGAAGDTLGPLGEEVEAIARRIPAVWRDGELICSLGEAYKSTNQFDAAIDAYREALRQPKASAPVEAIEQLANVLDRAADKLHAKGDVQKAKDYWDEADQKLEKLTELLGDSSERLALRGAIQKRRGRVATEQARPGFFQKAAEFYRKAYEHTRNTTGAIDPYPGLNWAAMLYLVGDPSNMPSECIDEAKRQKDAPTFWDRVYRPDAMVLEMLVKGTGAPAVSEVIDAYKSALQHSAPNERDSVLTQLKFLRDMQPNEADLMKILDALSAEI